MKKVEASRQGSLRFMVQVVPRSSRNEISGWTSEGVLKVRIKAAPAAGAANRELLKFIAGRLNISKSELRITSGLRSKRKRLEAPVSCKNRLLSFADI